MKDKCKIDYSVYLVTNRDILVNKNLYEAVEKAILGGSTLVQLREKDISTLEFLNIAEKLKKVTEKYNVPLIINDRIDIALAVNAEGVHVGQSDMPAPYVRRLIGSKKILGVSASNVQEAVKAEREGADYIGIGAIFKTNSKNDADSVSLSELKKINENIKIPSVAIGGICKDNIKLLKGSGIKGVSVISSILGKNDIQKAAKEIKNELKYLENNSI